MHLKSASKALLANVSLVPEDLKECLIPTMRNNWQTEHEFADRVSPFLYPFNIEFYLASSVLIVSFLARPGKVVHNHGPAVHNTCTLHLS